MQKLQFIENVNYLPAGEQESIDSELQELRELLEAGFGDYELYLQIRKNVLKELKYKDLAITRILPDLLQVFFENPNHFRVLATFVCFCLDSYSKIGEELLYSKQRVHQIVSIYRPRFPWVEALMERTKNE